MRLRRPVKDDVDRDLFAAADVDAVMLAVFEATIMCQFFIRILNADRPFLGLELRTDSFILCKLKAADLVLSTDVDVYFIFHSCLAVTPLRTSLRAYQPIAADNHN